MNIKMNTNTYLCIHTYTHVMLGANDSRQRMWRTVMVMTFLLKPCRDSCDPPTFWKKSNHHFYSWLQSGFVPPVYEKNSISCCASIGRWGAQMHRQRNSSQSTIILSHLIVCSNSILKSGWKFFLDCPLGFFE